MEEIELLDIANDLLIINKSTIEILFQEKDTNPLVLYMFYYKTAKWQKHNPIKANDEYCKRCLHWGIDRLQATKKRLKEMELIEIVRRTNAKGIVEGWYVKVNYLIDNSTIPETTIPGRPQLVSQETNTINNNILNTNNNINTKKEIYKEKRFKKPTLEEVKEYCKERKNNVDPERFINFYESKDWYIGKNKMKDWKACIRTWERNNKKEEDTPSWFDMDLDEGSFFTNEERERFKSIKRT